MNSNFKCNLLFIVCDRIIDAISFKHDHNIGTVLFERNDYGKQCWTSEEFAILSSRRMFQDILPQVNLARVLSSKNSFIDKLVFKKSE